MSEIIERSKLLRQNMTLENLFRLIVQDKDKVAARYLSGNEEKSVTYGVYEQRAYACAAALQSALPDAERGAFIGLSAMHERRDLIRAVLEGVVYSLRQNMDLLRSLGVTPAKVRLCGGGARSPLWRQMLADVFQMPVATTVNTEGPALGVAILAGVGAGLYASVPEACRAMIHVNPAQNPIAENVPQYEKVYALYTKLYQANKGLYKELAKL